MPYVERGGSWWPFWAAAGALGLLVVLDPVLPGGDVPPLLRVVALVVVPGIVAIGCLAARRAWTVRVDAEGLAVGREQLPLRDVDPRALEEGTAGPDAGAPVLGGGAELPRGRSGLPLRLVDGRTVLVPTRDPGALRTALRSAVAHASDGRPGREGTLGW